jgi:two-component system chemotaxis response regulator CheY
MPVEASPVEAVAPPLAPDAPAPESIPPVQAESDSEADAGAARTILTIDDSRTMRDMLRLALGGAGFTVVQAVDGQDGLKVLPQQPVDVIITDINMPKLDGYGVIRAVRSDPTYDDTPILVLSTEAEQGSKDIANEAGANGWIVKPFDPEGLVKLINTVCD